MGPLLSQVALAASASAGVCLLLSLVVVLFFIWRRHIRRIKRSYVADAANAPTDCREDSTVVCSALRSGFNTYEPSNIALLPAGAMLSNSTTGVVAPSDTIPGAGRVVRWYDWHGRLVTAAFPEIPPPPQESEFRVRHASAADSLFREASHISVGSSQMPYSRHEDRPECAATISLTAEVPVVAACMDRQQEFPTVELPCAVDYEGIAHVARLTEPVDCVVDSGCLAPHPGITAVDVAPSPIDIRRTASAVPASVEHFELSPEAAEAAKRWVEAARRAIFVRAVAGAPGLRERGNSNASDKPRPGQVTRAVGAAPRAHKNLSERKPVAHIDTRFEIVTGGSPTASRSSASSAPSDSCSDLRTPAAQSHDVTLLPACAATNLTPSGSSDVVAAASPRLTPNSVVAHAVAMAPPPGVLRPRNYASLHEERRIRLAAAAPSVMLQGSHREGALVELPLSNDNEDPDEDGVGALPAGVAGDQDGSTAGAVSPNCDTAARPLPIAWARSNSYREEHARRRLLAPSRISPDALKAVAGAGSASAALSSFPAAVTAPSPRPSRGASAASVVELIPSASPLHCTSPPQPWGGTEPPQLVLPPRATAAGSYAMQHASRIPVSPTAALFRTPQSPQIDTQMQQSLQPIPPTEAPSPAALVSSSIEAASALRSGPSYLDLHAARGALQRAHAPRSPVASQRQRSPVASRRQRSPVALQFETSPELRFFPADNSNVMASTRIRSSSVLDPVPPRPPAAAISDARLLRQLSEPFASASTLRPASWYGDSIDVAAGAAFGQEVSGSRSQQVPVQPQRQSPAMESTGRTSPPSERLFVSMIREAGVAANPSRRQGYSSRFALRSHLSAAVVRGVGGVRPSVTPSVGDPALVALPGHIPVQQQHLQELLPPQQRYVDLFGRRQPVVATATNDAASGSSSLPPRSHAPALMPVGDIASTRLIRSGSYALLHSRSVNSLPVLPPQVASIDATRGAAMPARQPSLSSPPLLALPVPSEVGESPEPER